MKRIKTNLLIALCFLFFAANAKAEGYMIHIELLSSPDPIEVSLSEYPTVTFNEGKLNISSNNLSCEISDIKKWTFNQGVPTEISSEKTASSVNYRDNVFTITGITSDNLNVFDLQGVKQAPATKFSGNNVIVDFNNLPNGVYIIKIGTQSYKVNKI